MNTLLVENKPEKHYLPVRAEVVDVESTNEGFLKAGVLPKDDNSIDGNLIVEEISNITEDLAETVSENLQLHLLTSELDIKEEFVAVEDEVSIPKNFIYVIPKLEPQNGHETESTYLINKQHSDLFPCQSQTNNKTEAENLHKDSSCSVTTKMNSVSNIMSLKNKPQQFTYEIKLQIKNMGPPRPELQINQTDKKNNKVFVRRFNANMYKHTDWICGCEIKSAFFCFTCLVMDCDASDLFWTSIGIKDLKHFSEKVKKHQLSDNHMNYSIEFNLLGRVNIRSQLSSAHRLNLQAHNENVRENRRTLNKLIDCIKFCDALCGHESPSFTSRGSINLLAQVDQAIKCKVFPEVSKTIQNDVLDSILAVSLNIIKNEINQAEYVAIQANETTDSATLKQMVLIIRYELNGVIYERFLGYLSPTDHTPQALGKTILNELEKLKINENPGKLIAQSYDGANGVPEKIKQVYPNCKFVHCYAHQLNLIMERAATQIKQIKIFFMYLEGFSTFFSRSARHTSVLDDVVKRRRPQVPSIRWNFNTKTVTTICIYKDDILACLEEIVGADDTDSSTFREAVGLKNILQDNDFNYWLRFFNKLIPNSEILIKQLQERNFDLKVKQCIEAFKVAVQRVRDAVDCEYYKEEFDAVDNIKRPRHDDSNNVLAKEVCDIIISNIEHRFTFSDHLSASLLFEPAFFSKHQHIFPMNEFRIAVKTYNLDARAFKLELAVIYNNEDFAEAAGALALLQLFTLNNLISTFPESVKLLKIICTIPMPTVETERCLSTLKHIKTFTKNTMKQDRLCALAMCSLEKSLIQNTDNFNDLVIDHFVNQKEKRLDFMYRSVN